MSARPAAHGRGPFWPWILTLFSLVMLAVRLHAEFMLPTGAEAWSRSWGFVPATINGVLQRPFSDWFDSQFMTLLSALFVHGDWAHLAGNLAYLWVFGITVERALGHWGMAITFLVLGALANLCLAWQMADSSMPVIGASGGVSAIIGVYLGLFPRRRIGLWLPLGLFMQFAYIPALLVIGSWFTLQLLYTAFGPVADAVAWWAHTAGFIAGVLLAMILRLVLPGVSDRAAPDRAGY